MHLQKKLSLLTQNLDLEYKTDLYFDIKFLLFNNNKKLDKNLNLHKKGIYRSSFGRLICTLGESLRILSHKISSLNDQKQKSLKNLKPLIKINLEK